MKSIVAVCLLCTGCALLNGAESPTSERVLTLLGQAVMIQDSICAQVAKERQDQNLANTCAIAYAGERAGLIAAASFVEAGNEEDAVCAALTVVKGIKSINDLLLSKGVEEPLLVKQALSIGDVLGGLCPAGK